MSRRPRALCGLALLAVVASGCSSAEPDALSDGEIARNEQFARLATSDRDPLIDVIAYEGRGFELVEATDPADLPAYAFPTCRTDMTFERDLALAVVPFTEWDVDRADENATMSRVLVVAWGGGGADESQVIDEYKVELSLVEAAAGCAAWTLTLADLSLG